jgi:hypothetical protein
MAQPTFHSDGNPASDRLRDSQRMRDENLNHDDDTAFEDPRIARERAEERERAEARGAARDHADMASRDDRNGGGFGTSFLGNRSTDEPLEKWRQIQADFVDNPRSAVSSAHGLVGNLIDDIVR